MDFQLFIVIAQGAAALYLIGVALVMHTKNFVSSLVFKVIPFFLGLALLAVLVKTTGFLN